MKKKAESRKKIKKDRSTFYLLVIALLLFVLVLVFFNKNILTGLFHRDTGRNREALSPPVIERIGGSNQNIDDIINENPKEITEPVNQNQTKESEAVENVEKEKSIKTALYFIKVNDDGAISLKSVIKTVFYTASPVEDTLAVLLKGPDAMEINKGLFTLIPENTKILSMKLENNTAYLNFNEDFLFNTLGREGYIAQLQQIVYTVTEFNNINEVQFIIEGKKIDYLGADGIYIGEPLRREDF